MERNQKLTKEQEKKLKKIQDKLLWGWKHKKVFTYPSALIDALRPYHVGGMPASIMVLVNELCNGYCYDRATLMSLAFDDAKIVHGNIESLRITSGEEHAEHAFVETKAFGGNKSWIVDTSIGLIYEKDFYFKLENVSVNKEFSKEQIMNSYDVKSILAGDFEKEKWALAITLPLVEAAVEHSIHLGSVMYRDFVKQEFEKLKKAIDYEDMQAEIDADMKMMKTNPKALDEKFEVVRDRYGREISRNGVPNPYYISPEDADAMQAKYEEAQSDPTKKQQLMQEILEKCFHNMEVEEQAVLELAELRMQEILKNPTRNCYDKPSQME